jgi:hypothetical protein
MRKIPSVWYAVEGNVQVLTYIFSLSKTRYQRLQIILKFIGHQNPKPTVW